MISVKGEDGTTLIMDGTIITMNVDGVVTDILGIIILKRVLLLYLIKRVKSFQKVKIFIFYSTRSSIHACSKRIP